MRHFDETCCEHYGDGMCKIPVSYESGGEIPFDGRFHTLPARAIFNWCAHDPREQFYQKCERWLDLEIARL